jgi:PAS domain S-box-containing protein
MGSASQMMNSESLPADPTESRYRALFHSIDEGLCVLEMIFDDSGKPADYRFEEYNPSFEKMTGLQNALGKTARELVPDLEEFWFETYGKVALTGESIRFENHSVPMNRWFSVFASRIGGNRSRKVNLVFTDITERKRAEEALRESEWRYKTLFDSMDECYCVIELIYDDGKPVDFLFLEANSAFKKVTGWEDIAGRTIREFSPDHEQHWFDVYGRVVESGEPSRFVQQSGVLDDRWFSLYAFRIGGPESRKLAVLFTDITDQLRAESEIKELAHRNLDILESITDSFFALDRDWRFTYVNRQAEKLLGREEGDLLGLTLWEEYPGLVGSEFEQAYLRTLKERVPVTLTSYYPDHSRWYEIHSYPAANGITVYFRNVTERIESEEAIRSVHAQIEQQARIFDTTLSSITDFAYTFDRDGRFSYINKALLDLWGLKLEDALGKNFFDLKYPDDLAEKLQRQIQEVFDTGSIVTDETPYTSPTGAGGYYEYIFNPVRGADGTVETVAGSTRDITTRKRLEGNLAFLAEISKDLASLTSVEDIMQTVGEKIGAYLRLSICAIVEIDESGDWADINHSWNRPDVPSVSGSYRLGDFLSREFQNAAWAGEDFIISDTRKDPRSNEKQFDELSIRSFLSVPLLKGGECRLLLIVYHSEPHSWQPDEIDLTRELASRIWNTLERARAEKALNEFKDELERRVEQRTAELAIVNETLRTESSERLRIEEERVRILHQLVTAQEDARRRIGRDLHDQLGQQVTALRLKLEALKAACAHDPEFLDHVDQAEQYAKQIDSDVSFLAMELRPVALDDLGLVAAVDNFVREWSNNHGIPAEFHTTGVGRPDHTPDVEINVYRIVQEALNNILKHAHPSNVTIIMETRYDHLILIIEDDGMGFNPHDVSNGNARKGLGLTGIRERCMLLGGSFEIESAHGEGTVLYVRVPPKKVDD